MNRKKPETYVVEFIKKAIPKNQHQVRTTGLE